MEENKNFDDNFMDELYAHIDEIVEDVIVDQIESTVSSSVQDAIEDALLECLSRFEFVLPDGTLVKPKQRLKLLSPNKNKMLICYGGLRVDGKSLMVQTSTQCWTEIAYYNNQEEAIEALSKVKDAIIAEIPVLEL